MQPACRGPGCAHACLQVYKLLRVEGMPLVMQDSIVCLGWPQALLPSEHTRSWSLCTSKGGFPSAMLSHSIWWVCQTATSTGIHACCAQLCSQADEKSAKRQGLPYRMSTVAFRPMICRATTISCMCTSLITSATSTLVTSTFQTAPSPKQRTSPGGNSS